MKKLNNLLNVMMGSFFGVFVGRSIHAYWFYKTHPDIYVHFSSPWYTDIIFYALVSGVIIVALLIAKFFIKRKMLKDIKTLDETDINAEKNSEVASFNSKGNYGKGIY